MRNFRELEIWQEAVNVSVICLRLIKEFPQEDKYIIGKQIQRSAISIPSNIPEGCSRNTQKEFIRFLNIALGSAFELETQILIAKEIKIISSEDYSNLKDRLNVLQKRINAFRSTIKAGN
jgi:four helix bundle protein